MYRFNVNYLFIQKILNMYGRIFIKCEIFIICRLNLHKHKIPKTVLKLCYSKDSTVIKNSKLLYLTLNKGNYNIYWKNSEFTFFARTNQIREARAGPRSGRSKIDENIDHVNNTPRHSAPSRTFNLPRFPTTPITSRQTP